MSLKDKDLAPLFLPGTIAFPPPFPAVGELEIQEDGAEFEKAEPCALVIVRRRVRPSTKVSWIILVDHVSAIVVTSSKGDELDPATARWHFGPSVRRLKSPVEGKTLKGIVYVPEDAPVMMRLEFGQTASEIIDYPIPGVTECSCDPCSCCNPCCCPTFSYENVMGRPDKG